MHEVLIIQLVGTQEQCLAEQQDMSMLGIKAVPHAQLLSHQRNIPS